MSKKGLIIFFILFFVSFFLVAYQYKNTPINGRSFISDILSSPFDLLSFLSNSIKTNVKNLLNTYAENKILKEQLNKTLMERQMYSEIIQENKRLKAILSLKEQEPKYLTAAKVIAKGYDRFLQTITIDKGKSNGIKKDMAVITTKGLIGKIYSVRENFSDVLLLKDPNFSVAVRLQNSRVEGIVSGTGGKYCILKYISPEEDIKPDETVITSGLDGIFPQGIPVGTIKSIKKEGIEFFLNIQIKPFQENEKIEEVIILGH